MEKSYPMSGGNGPQSYAQNSSPQFFVLAENKVEFNRTTLRIRIADLGCSTGPNTFTAVQNIIEALSSSHELAEFEVLFNDHISNDFNTLLRSLPPSGDCRKYFAAAVPGSFHGRLFPRSSLHFVHSSSALQWLSDVPKGVAEKGSAAWNDGSIYCTGLVKPVLEAYSGQFRADFMAFLRSRAEEVVSGGWIAIVMPGRPHGVVSCRTTLGVYCDLLGASLRDLTGAGLIDVEKLESFNIPVYFPTMEELGSIVMEDGSFSIEKAEEVTHDNKTILSTIISTNSGDIRLVAEAVTRSMRALNEALIRHHFGLGDEDEKVVNQLFECYASRVAAAYHDVCNPNVTHSNIILMVRRN